MIVEVAVSDDGVVRPRARNLGTTAGWQSLREYVLVAQDEVRVERYTRQGDDWVLTELNRLEDTLRLTSIGCEVSLREIYAKVDFPEVWRARLKFVDAARLRVAHGVEEWSPSRANFRKIGARFCTSVTLLSVNRTGRATGTIPSAGGRVD